MTAYEDVAHFDRIARQFVEDWRAATIGRGGHARRSTGAVDWRPNATAASRALHRLLANLQRLDVGGQKASPARALRAELCREARRLIEIVPHPGARDQGAIQEFWTAADALIEQLQNCGTSEMAAHREQAGQGVACTDA